VLVEGIAASSLSKQADAMRKLIGAAGNVRMTGDVYPLAYSLTSNGQ
jgi:hypothetical protein